MYTMSDVDEKYFSITEKEIQLESEYFNEVLKIAEHNSEAVIEENIISGISFWDIIPDTSDIECFGENMYDDIDFSSDDDNTINMWCCIRDYVDESIEYRLRDSETAERNKKLLAKLKELSEGDFDSHVKILRKVK